jgi:hypothetical protein
MELQNYTWFIYVLTLLLLMAIMLIFVLIGFKCLQTCAYTSVMCFKKRRRRRRIARNANRQNSEISSYSTDSEDSSSSSSSSNSENSNNYNSTRFGLHPDRQAAHENMAYTPDLEYAVRLPSDKVINRKFDDLTRFCKFNDNNNDPVKIINNVNTISDFVDQSFNFLNHSDVLIKGQIRSKVTEEVNSLNSTLRVTQLDNTSFNESYSIVGNDEIPPAYEQVVKESRV